MNNTFTNFRVNFSNSRTYEGFFTEAKESGKKSFSLLSKLRSMIQNTYFKGVPTILAKIGKAVFFTGCAVGILAISVAVLCAQLSLFTGLILGGSTAVLAFLSSVVKF